jgi:hypothetical protein
VDLVHLHLDKKIQEKKIHKRKTLPKMQFLEDHVVPWIRKYGVGMEFHAEQGGQRAHKELNIKWRRTASIKIPLLSLKSAFKNYLLRVNPEIHACTPGINVLV